VARKLFSLIFLALVGCDDFVTEPDFVEEGDVYRAFGGFRPGISDFATTIGASVAYGDVRPVSFAAISICDAAAVVLGHALNTTYSCSPGSGAVSMYFPTGTGAQLLDAFIRAVEAGGGSVVLVDNQIVVSGGDGDSFSGVNAGDEVAFGDPGPVTATMSPPTELLDVIASAGVTVPALHIERAPSGVSVDELTVLAEELGANLRAFDVSGDVWVAYTRSQQSDAVIGIASANDAETVILPVLPPGDGVLDPLLARFLTVDAVPVPQGLAVIGPPVHTRQFIAAAAPLFVYRRDYRVSAAFLSFVDASGFDLSVDVSGGFDLGENVTIGLASSGASLSVLLDGAVARGRASVVSRPTLVVSSGDRGVFRSGSEVPITTSVTNDGVTTEAVEFREVGITLEVSPTPLPDGVLLDIVLVVSSISEASLDGVPIFNTQSYSGSVVAQIGEVLVISGLVDDNKDQTSGLGFFSSLSRSQSASQLQILLTAN